MKDGTGSFTTAFTNRDLSVSGPQDGVSLIQILSEPLGVLRVGLKKALARLLAELESDPRVRVVVITGVGRAFSVGSDIREFRQDGDWLREASLIEQQLYSAIENSRLPVIAACNGYTLGGGAELALACDLRVAGESAEFGFPEVKVGTFASGGGTQRLPRYIGRGRAMRMLLTGSTVDAGQALQLGLVDEVVRDDAVFATALTLASDIAGLPPSAVAATKRCLNVGLSEGAMRGYALEVDLAVDVGLTNDAAEGQAAFLEKRAPRFSHP